MVEYRRSRMTDIDDLTQMRVSMLCDGTNYDESFKSKLYNNTKAYLTNGFHDQSFTIWVATDGDGIIGMGGLTYYTLPPNDWCPSGKTAYLGSMYIMPDYRRNSIATKLLSLLIDEAKDNGCERIFLDATDMGKPLYEKYGFAKSNTAMAYYPFGIIPQS